MCFAGAFSKECVQNHPAVQSLCTYIDLQHTCGYVSLLNTGLLSKSIWKDDSDDEYEDDQNDFYAKGDNSSISSTDNSSKMGDNSPSHPSNGVKDKALAEMLASELDLLESDAAQKSSDDTGLSNLKQNMSLDLKCENNNSKKSMDYFTRPEDWVLLDCFFGIPLFDASLNKETCSKIVSHGIFKQER